MITFAPAEPDQWRAVAVGMRENIEGDLERLVAFYRTPEGPLRLAVTRTTAVVKLPDKRKLALDEWLALTPPAPPLSEEQS